MEKLLTSKELAEALKGSTKTIRRLIKADKIPYYRVLSMRRFDLDEVLDAIRYVPEHLKVDRTKTVQKHVDTEDEA